MGERYAYPETGSARQTTGHYIPVLLVLKVNFETVSLFGKAHAVEWYCLNRDLGSLTRSILVGLPLVSRVSGQHCRPARKGGMIRPAEERQACLDLYRPHSWRSRRPILRDRARFWTFCWMSHEIHRGRGDRCFALYTVYKAGPAAGAKMSNLKSGPGGRKCSWEKPIGTGSHTASQVICCASKYVFHQPPEY
jgi:hypothetical protein